MKTQLAKWGNSFAIRIPVTVAKAASLGQGDVVEVKVIGEGAISVRKLSRAAKLRELLRAITRENLHEEIDWRAPKERETW
jgi:antitoxin MazE